MRRGLEHFLQWCDTWRNKMGEMGKPWGSLGFSGSAWYCSCESSASGEAPGPCRHLASSMV